MKKILIFSVSYYPKHIGGAEVAIKEITDRIPSDEYEFHLICNRYDATLLKKERIGHVFVHRIGWVTTSPTMSDLRTFPLHINKILYQWYAFWFAKKLHKKEKFDGIWAMMAHATGVPAAKFKKTFPDVQYVLTLQEGDPPAHIEKKMRWFGKTFTNAFTRADRIQVISNFLGSWAVKQGFQGKPVLIPNAVTTSHFNQAYPPETLLEVRKELGVSSSDILLVTTSRLVNKNALDDVVRALVLLPTNVKFIIFGVGPEEQLLKDLIQKNKLMDRVFLKGEITHAVMPKYLKACDIFVRPSRSEGMGNSFVEAMAAGLPVIATQEGGIADFLFDSRRNPDTKTTGWAVDVNNPKQIAVAVQDIINNPDKVKEVTTHARAMAIEKYDWNLIATRMKKEIFDTLWSE